MSSSKIISSFVLVLFISIEIGSIIPFFQKSGKYQYYKRLINNENLVRINASVYNNTLIYYNCCEYGSCSCKDINGLPDCESQIKNHKSGKCIKSMRCSRAVFLGRRYYTADGTDFII